MKKIVIILILSLTFLFSCGENKYTDEYCNKCYMDEMLGSGGVKCFDKNISDSEKANIAKYCDLKTVQ